MDDYIRQYGTRGLSLLIGRFIQLAPDFPGGEALAREIGSAVGLLEVQLDEYTRLHSK